MAYLDDAAFVLNIQPIGLPTIVRLSQNENGRRLYFTIVGNESAIPSGVTVTLSGTKPDGVVYSKTGSITNGVVLINEDMQLTAVAGNWDAKIKIVSGGQTVATGRVRFIIDADPVAPGSVPSDSQLEGLVAEAEWYAENARSAAYGSPLVASTVAGMTDHTRVYVYTGSETGYTAGNWYYWNGSAWTSGGVYNSTALQTDTTLAIPGMAADAKATGDAIDGLDDRLTDSESELADVKSDLVNLQDEIDSFEGISEEVKEALLFCFEHVAWIDEHGQDYYDALYDALYSGASFDYVWSSLSGLAPTGMTYESITFAADNEYATIDKPALFAGFGDKEIEMELAVVSGGDTNASISIVDKYGYGCRLSFNNGHPLLIAIHDNYQDNVMTVDSVDASEFNKYSISLRNGRVTFKINDEIISTGDFYRNAYWGQPIISASNPMSSSNYSLTANIKSIRYKNNGLVSNKKVLKYYRNKGVEFGTPNLSDNTKRITTDLIYFQYNAPVTIRVVGLTENNLQYGIKPIDGDGNIWSWHQGDAYQQGFQKPNYSTIPSPSNWLNEEVEYTSVTRPGASGSWTYDRLRITNGTVRLLIADGQSTDNELNRAISGSVFVNGEEYVLEEGVYE